MKRLEGKRELLDGPLDRRALAGNLRDLARVNRWLGGASLSWRALEHLRRTAGDPSRLSLIDVGTGAADIPVALRRRAVAAGFDLEIEALDARPEIVEIARRHVGGSPGLTLRVGDAAGAGDGRRFDVVHCSLVLHHYDGQEAASLLAAMARQARLGVIINDLVRGRRWWLAAWLLARIATRNPYTRHDAPLSVRRAWQPNEVASMATRAGLQPDAGFHDPLGHRYALVFRPSVR